MSDRTCTFCGTVYDDEIGWGHPEAACINALYRRWQDMVRMFSAINFDIGVIHGRLFGLAPEVENILAAFYEKWRTLPPKDVYILDLLDQKKKAEGP